MATRQNTRHPLPFQSEAASLLQPSFLRSQPVSVGSSPLASAGDSHSLRFSPQAPSDDSSQEPRRSDITRKLGTSHSQQTSQKGPCAQGMCLPFHEAVSLKHALGRSHGPGAAANRDSDVGQTVSHELLGDEAFLPAEETRDRAAGRKCMFLSHLGPPETGARSLCGRTVSGGGSLQ